MTCKVWIILNPSMFSSGYFGDTGQYFPLFSYFLWILTAFYQWFYSNSLLLNIPLLLAASPFYSVILRLQGTTDSPHLPLLGTRTNIVSTTLVAGPFLISHNFLLLVLLPQKSPANFPFWGVLKDMTFDPSSFKASHLFQTQLLAAFPLVICPKWADSFLLGW